MYQTASVLKPNLASQLGHDASLLRKFSTDSVSGAHVIFSNVFLHALSRVVVLNFFSGFSGFTFVVEQDWNRYAAFCGTSPPTAGGGTWTTRR